MDYVTNWGQSLFEGKDLLDAFFKGNK